MATRGVLHKLDLPAGTWGTAGLCRGRMEPTRVREKENQSVQVMKVLIFHPLQTPASAAWVVLNPAGDKWSGAVGVNSECFKSGHLSRPVSCISEDASRAGVW